MEDSLKQELEDFISIAKSNETETSIAYALLKEKADYVVKKVLDGTLTNQETAAIYKATNEVISICLAEIFTEEELTKSRTRLDSLYYLLDIVSRIGYYMGKTGEKFEGV